MTATTATLTGWPSWPGPVETRMMTELDHRAELAELAELTTTGQDTDR